MFQIFENGERYGAWDGEEGVEQVNGNDHKNGRRAQFPWIKKHQLITIINLNVNLLTRKENEK